MLGSILLIASSAPAAPPAWDEPSVANADMTSDQIGWSVDGRRAILWKRNVPAAAPVAIVRQRHGRATGARPPAPVPHPVVARRRLRAQPLASLTVGGDCTNPRATKVLTIRLPLRDPLQIGSAPVSMRLTYHLAQRQGWVNPQMRVTANEVTATAIPGATQVAGEMRLWLDPDEILLARGVTARVMLVVASRRPVFAAMFGAAPTCGMATFALDTLEIDQG